VNRPFIKQIVESYLIDKELDKKKFDELHNYVLEEIEFLKLDFKCAYDLLHEFDMVSQQNYIYHILDLKDVELTTESDIFTITTAILIGALPYLYNTDYARELAQKVLSGIVKARMGIVEFLENKPMFKRYKTIDKIISSNFEDCKRKAGINNNVSDSMMSTILHSKIKGSYPLDKDQHDKLELLINCYIDYLVSMVANLTVIYSKCVEETGESKLKTDMGINSILSIPTGSKCQVLHDQLRELHASLIDVLEIFYPDDNRVKQDWINRLDDAIKSSTRGEFLRGGTPFKKFQNDSGFKDKFQNPSKQFEGTPSWKK
jgi:hypothetical protein